MRGDKDPVDRYVNEIQRMNEILAGNPMWIDLQTSKARKHMKVSWCAGVRVASLVAMKFEALEIVSARELMAPCSNPCAHPPALSPAGLCG